MPAKGHILPASPNSHNAPDLSDCGHHRMHILLQGCAQWRLAGRLTRFVCTFARLTPVLWQYLQILKHGRGACMAQDDEAAHQQTLPAGWRP